MKGTEKQVKWAEDIKARIFSALDAMSNTSRQAEFRAFCAWLDNKSSAAWWIDGWQLTGTDIMFIGRAIREFKAA